MLSNDAPSVLTGHSLVGGKGAAIFRTRQTQAFPDPATPDLSIQLCTAGRFLLQGDAGFGRFHAPSVTPGMFGVGASDVPFDLEGEGRFEMLIVSLPWHAFRPMAEEATGRDLPHLGRVHEGIKRDGVTEWLVHTLWHEAERGGPSGSLFTDSLLTTLVTRLLLLSDTHVVPPPQKARLSPTDQRRAMDFIRDRLGENLTLSEIAAAVGFSPSHFSALFRRSLGIPPHQYVIQQRVERARSLLLQCPELTIARVAAQVGFADHSHLSRHMKRLLGVTPGKITG